MLASIVPVVLAFAASVSALSAEVPVCANTCASSVTSGSCAAFDISCYCTTDSYMSDIAACVISSCPQSDVNTALELAYQACEAVSVELPAPSAALSSLGVSTGSVTLPATFDGVTFATALPVSSGAAASAASAASGSGSASAVASASSKASSVSNMLLSGSRSTATAAASSGVTANSGAMGQRSENRVMLAVGVILAGVGAVMTL
ncbi:hypothetical protein YB2330_002232 [Saitoella coloradoensis]